MNYRFLSTLIIALATISILSSCEKERQAQKPVFPPVEPISSGNRVIYEVNVHAYSETHNFKGLENDLERLKDIGVDIVWLMPIHPIGEVNRQGELGSPYAVVDYKAVNPEYGTIADFKSLVSKAHSLGMEIWLDWVANHTAWDNIWVESNIEFYASKDGECPYSPPGWNDAVQLDHSSPGLVDAMADAMIFWVKECNIDGFRCDAADRVPFEFWKSLKSKVDAVRKVTWLSEGWSEKNMEIFDYDYAWDFADELQDFGTTGDVNKLVSACKALHRDETYRARGRMTYITNHDLNAYYGSEFYRYKSNVLPLTVLSYTVFDLPLVYNGQEIGMDKSMNFAEDVTVDWSVVNKRYVSLHKKLCHLKHSQPALTDGSERGMLKVYPTSEPTVFAFSRIREDNEVLVLLNLGDFAARCRFTDELPVGTFLNWLDEEYYEFTNEGIPLRENGYAIFVKGAQNSF